MNRSELCSEVKGWLEASKISFLTDEEESFRFRINGDHGLFDVRLLCEDEPALLQAFCPLPVRIPAARVSEAALLLHNLNAQLRIGHFRLHVEARVVELRLTMPLRPEAGLAEQLEQTVGTIASTMDEYVGPLGLLACNTSEFQAALAKLLPDLAATSANPRLPSGRLEFN